LIPPSSRVLSSRADPPGLLPSPARRFYPFSGERGAILLESSPRGIYTGAIGILLPGGDMTFSVAIRTVTLRDGLAEAGAGGGIVWDSDPREEYREACLKGRYLSEPPVSFQLIETFLWSPGTGFRFLPEHLRRLARPSSRY